MPTGGESQRVNYYRSAIISATVMYVQNSSKRNRSNYSKR